MATCSSILAWRIPWTEEPGALQYASILAWRIPWTEEPGALQSMGCRVGHDSATTQQQRQQCIRNCHSFILSYVIWRHKGPFLTCHLSSGLHSAPSDGAARPPPPAVSLLRLPLCPRPPDLSTSVMLPAVRSLLPPPQGLWLPLSPLVGCSLLLLLSRGPLIFRESLAPCETPTASGLT